MPVESLFRDLILGAGPLSLLRTAVVHPVDLHSIETAAAAASAGYMEPILVGPESRIRLAVAAFEQAGGEVRPWTIVDTEHSHAAAETATAMAAGGRVDALMKGALHSDELLHPIVAAGSGLRTESRISHAYLLAVPSYPKPLIITDAAINIAPGLADKADICRNAIGLWHSLWGEARKPKVALLSAVETVTPGMPSTVDAAALCKMAERGQIAGAILDGPLAYDNIVSRRAAEDKGIVSEVAGDADIIVVPNIETGNALAKQLIYLGNAQAAGIVLGARVPVMLTSRADPVETRLLSCVVAMYLAEARRKGVIK